jgi:hypothetical protein
LRSVLIFGKKNHNGIASMSKGGEVKLEFAYQLTQGLIRQNEQVRCRAVTTTINFGTYLNVFFGFFLAM